MTISLNNCIAHHSFSIPSIFVQNWAGTSSSNQDLLFNFSLLIHKVVFKRVCHTEWLRTWTHSYKCSPLKNSSWNEYNNSKMHWKITRSREEENMTYLNKYMKTSSMKNRDEQSASWHYTIEQIKKWTNYFITLLILIQ